jgi:hypothetical protein
MKTASSALLTAALLAVSVVALTLLLNPAVEPMRESGSLLLALFLPYLVGGFAVLLLAGLAASLIRGKRPTRAPLQDLPWFTTLSSVTSAYLIHFYWDNLQQYRDSLPGECVRALTIAFWALCAALAVQLSVIITVSLSPTRGRGASAAVVVLAAMSQAIVPLALRPDPALEREPLPLTLERTVPLRRLTLVGLDALGPEQLEAGMRSGSLPALAALLKQGAYGPLATLRPTEAPPIWTTIVTGHLPRHHGVKSFVSYRLRGSAQVYELLPQDMFVGLLERFGLVSKTPIGAAVRRRRALWSILNGLGISTGVVRQWATFPVEPTNGFMVSNYYHLLDSRTSPTLFPPEAAPAPLLGPPSGAAAGDEALLEQFIAVPPGHTPRDDSSRRQLLQQAIGPDLIYQRVGDQLRSTYDPVFFATYFFGLDIVGHAYLRYAQPDDFGNVRPDQVRRFGRVTEAYAGFLSRYVGKLAARRRPDEILMVVSGYGMKPTPIPRRLAAALSGRDVPSGTHRDGPPGFILVVGDGIRPGSRFRNASVVDVAPTILYLMGLPVARDMPGRVATEVLEPDFARTHAVTYIPSYESARMQLAPGPDDLDLPPLPEEGP